MALRSKCSFNEQQGLVKQAGVRGNNRCHVGKTESATGAMQRSGQAADREDIERQAESKGRQQTVRVYRQSRKTQGNRIQGKCSECQPGQNKTLQRV